MGVVYNLRRTLRKCKGLFSQSLIDKIAYSVFSCTLKHIGLVFVHYNLCYMHCYMIRLEEVVTTCLRTTSGLTDKASYNLLISMCMNYVILVDI